MVTDFGCLGGALMIAMLFLCSSSTVLSDTLCYKASDSLLLRGQNTSCGFQQQEAGVTPEARRDRAAILRHDGVAPASDRVLTALRFLAVSVASACSFCLLSPCQGDPGGEILRERCLLGTFHGYVYCLVRMPLEQRGLSVHGCGNKGDLRRRLKLDRFRPHRVLGNLPHTPSLVQILYARIAESLFSPIDKQDVVLL